MLALTVPRGERRVPHRATQGSIGTGPQAEGERETVGQCLSVVSMGKHA